MDNVSKKFGMNAGSFKFEKSVIFVATVLLIVLLAAVGIMAYSAKYGDEYPPVQSECPDYWTVNSEGKCVNEKNLGTCTDSTQHEMDFTTSEWTGNDGLTNKCKWARDCNITWDGVTNNTSACNPNASSSGSGNGSSSGGISSFLSKLGL